MTSLVFFQGCSPPPPTFVDVMSTARQERVTKVLTGWRMTLSRNAATVIRRCNLPPSAYENFPTGSWIGQLICGHHTHEASEVKATTRTICTERAASHLNASTTKTLIRVYICYNSSFHHEYIPPPSTGYFSAVVVEHPVYWRVGDEIVDDPVQRVGFVDLVVGGWGRTRAEGGGPGKRRVEGAGCRGDGREGVRAAVNDRARSD